MPTQRQQKRTARRNQELRALDQEIFELKSQLSGTEALYVRRTEERDALQVQIDTMQKPPLRELRRILERVTFLQAVDSEITDELTELRGYLKSLGVAAGNDRTVE